MATDPVAEGVVLDVGRSAITLRELPQKLPSATSSSPLIINTSAMIHLLRRATTRRGLFQSNLDAPAVG